MTESIVIICACIVGAYAILFVVAEMFAAPKRKRKIQGAGAIAAVIGLGVLILGRKSSSADGAAFDLEDALEEAKAADEVSDRFNSEVIAAGKEAAEARAKLSIVPDHDKVTEKDSEDLLAAAENILRGEE